MIRSQTSRQYEIEIDTHGHVQKKYPNLVWAECITLMVVIPFRRFHNLRTSIWTHFRITPP